MRRQHPDHRMDIPISMQVYHQLITASNNTGFEKEDWEIAAEAIDEWVRRHDPDALPAPAASGYQWKRLFLPDGTVLRTVFGGKNHHCVVQGDTITYDGKPVSPSGFVNAVGGIRRNAWLCTWILFPDTKEWKLADALRSREGSRRAPRVREAARASRQADATQAGAVGLPVNVPTANVPLPAKIEAVAARSLEERSFPQAIGGQVQTEPRCGDADRQPRSAITPSPPRCKRGADRRTNGDDRMTALPAASAVATRTSLLRAWGSRVLHCLSEKEGTR